MKMLRKIYLLIFLIVPFLTTGCYTVLWTPDEELPNDSNYEYYDDYTEGYYSDDFIYYYEYPWWLSFTPQYKYRSDDNSSERDKGTSTLRNNGNGRGDSDRSNEVINTPPPTRDYTPPSEDSNKNSGNNNTTSGTTRTQTGNSDSSNSGSTVRNNDGNRNSGRGR